METKNERQITDTERKLILQTEEVKRKARMLGIPMWKLADCLGMSEMTFYRRCRHGLPQEAYEKCIEFLNSVASECDYL